MLMASSDELPYPALSPYPIPSVMTQRKVVNLGDGFILRAIERHLGGKFKAEWIFSPRVDPDLSAKQVMKSASLVILAGANQLNDRYTVWPGLDASQLHSEGYRFVPFGIGLHGEEGYNDGMSEKTKSIMEAMHSSIEFSSWRCPKTVSYLKQNLPHLAHQFLMTGCPVVFDLPLLEGDRFSIGERSVAVTATERGEFWERETAIIDAVAERFPRSRKYFVAHQNFSPEPWSERWLQRFSRRATETAPDKVIALRSYARSRGFETVAPRDAATCIDFYDSVDVHVGTRLHAHLLFLSRNKRSFLVPVDERSSGMADFLGFPLPAASELHRHWDFDFEVVRRNALHTYPTLMKFVKSISP